MFLTKKALRKCILSTLVFVVLGILCVCLAFLAADPQIDTGMLYLGIGCLLFSPLLFILARYSEGTAKLVNLGNELVHKQLQPGDFLKLYEFTRHAPDLVVNKPRLDVLQLAAVAYDCLNNKDNTLAVADKMLTVASEKKKTYAKLLKVSFLFGFGMVEEAEALFVEACNEKQDIMSQALTDAILKSDRAMAMGDYKTVEIYTLNRLAQTFPKPTNLSKLICHFRLGEIYEKLNEPQKAIPYYQYCINYGGKTAIKEPAKTALERLQ